MREARLATWGPVQQRCADALHVEQSQISRWERGQSPSAYDLARFARACNRTVEDLLPGERAVVAEQLLLGLEPKAAAVVVDLVQLLRKGKRQKRA